MPTTSSGGPATGDPFPGTIGPTPANGWGHVGAGGGAYPAGASGGGGAGGAGNSYSGTTGGAGGIGIQIPTTFRDPAQAPSDTSNPQPYQRGGGLGTPGPAGSYYIAGGGAGGTDSPAPQGVGGSGGGGMGGNDPTGTNTNALENTGSGGGGGYGHTDPNEYGGNGGSGIVLIAYPS